MPRDVTLKGTSDELHWRPAYRVAVILSVAMLATFIVTGVNIAADTGYVGLFQRIVLTMFVT